MARRVQRRLARPALMRKAEEEHSMGLTGSRRPVASLLGWRGPYGRSGITSLVCVDAPLAASTPLAESTPLRPDTDPVGRLVELDRPLAVVSAAKIAARKGLIPIFAKIRSFCADSPKADVTVRCVPTGARARELERLRSKVPIVGYQDRRIGSDPLSSPPAEVLRVSSIDRVLHGRAKIIVAVK
ncbi:hypothetical protein BDZ90DRAFT_125214 [Jaminaea rosea]|uniref:Uncharacterized protein n=1 Tax=Jaminaea rosea TaxID=1569628 RepID=A0A316UHT4_9BASI|nr:hypothetical protein BDZ90DRAFT_125214 [Jaminaea rosea]PWN24464.1 hypothetical protein BDZ90DRAFT_125214 [Jaminaea rosea]